MEQKLETSQWIVIPYTGTLNRKDYKNVLFFAIIAPGNVCIHLEKLI